MFKRILFPVDFSPQCEAVAPAIASLARCHGAGLVILHSLEMPPAAYADWAGFSVMVDMDALREAQQKQLESFDPGPMGNLPVERVTNGGPPVHSILECARKQEIDLIAMPTHGYGMFRSLLLGSITAGVLHDSELPVWTATHAAEDSTPHAPYERILCAVDVCSSAAKVLSMASRLAAHHGAELRAVHAIPSVYDPVMAFDPADFRHTLMEDARLRYSRIEEAAKVQVPLEILEGPIGTTVSELASSWDADLLVIGRGHLTATLGRLRTHAYDLIRRSPCPVLSV
jgi:nucleotide-binding universal stress UspA family protein